MKYNSLIKAPELRSMTEIEAAWIGAMIEAEGCVQSINGKRLNIRVVNTDPEIISALLRATGIGNVYTRPLTHTYKLVLEWRCVRKLDTLALAKRCSSYSIKCQWLAEQKG